MESLNLHIKNMVCPRCIMVVKSEIEKLGAIVLDLKLGFASISAPKNISKELIRNKLKEFGFELITDNENLLVEKVKISVLDYLRQQEDSLNKVTLSEFLSMTIGKNYNSLSRLFSKHETETIEHFYISQRIKKVMELLDYDELNLSEIAIKLQYSSVHYLSNQFKKVTGTSVSQYKKKAAMRVKYYYSLSQVLMDLKNRGYSSDFYIRGNHIQCDKLNTLYTLRDLVIEEAGRIKWYEDMGQETKIYSFESKDGVKGTFVSKPTEMNSAIFNQLNKIIKMSA